MECNRKDCDNIMCNEYSEVTGYLCDECKTDLDDSCPKSVSDVEAFMETPKVDNRFGSGDKFSLNRLFGHDDES